MRRVAPIVKPERPSRLPPKLVEVPASDGWAFAFNRGGTYLAAELETELSGLSSVTIHPAKVRTRNG
jgi:hypothetical protein